MKHSKPVLIQTTLGELITVLCEESQKLFNFKQNERQLVVAYILNELAGKSVSPRHRARPKRYS